MMTNIWSDQRYLLTGEQSVIDKIIKPVLECLGWDPRDSNQVVFRKQRKDIILFRNRLILVCLECKKLNSPEFCITIHKGDIRKAEKGDGVAQLRRYCHWIASRQSSPPIPVITNGLRWIIFNEGFLDSDRKNKNIDPSKDILTDTLIIQASFLNDLSVLRK